MIGTRLEAGPIKQSALLAKPAKAIRETTRKEMAMPPVATPRPSVAKRVEAMTPDERRAHVIPATRARLYHALRRHIVRVLDNEPTITAEQRDALVSLLRGEAR